MGKYLLIKNCFAKIKKFDRITLAYMLYFNMSMMQVFLMNKKDKKMNNLTPFDVKKTLKRGFIYLLIALPFMAVVAVLLTIVKAPYFLILSATVVIGGAVVLLCFLTQAKKDEKKKLEEELNPSKKFDPFKD